MRSFRSLIVFLLITTFSATLTANSPKEATGFVRVSKINGVWWFIDPDGKRFVSTGGNPTDPHLWLA